MVFNRGREKFLLATNNLKIKIKNKKIVLLLPWIVKRCCKKCCRMNIIGQR